MDATLDLIHEEGLQSVTFSKIFKKVGAGTIYNYFSNKEEFVNAIYKEARMLMGECHQFIHGIVSSILKGYYVRKYPLNESQTQQVLESSWKALLV
ncbi:TetR/AcrR family transcriptional regulator [Paenibacillus sp. GCM10023250]|uniref:TetR/AcrR family transcriptional regulator n=1 Tax=Paenibacillus sp. GCM10023250 TaxID=3252648 RepID=UPI0036187757